ncbi:MAG: hypothetical protein K8W52_26375 [Deltaproteobacteria bacterium]|nr:hypothetical protein [Deltaproteobacteria bacterium]
MRPYLYVWNDPVARELVASGLQFADLAPAIRGGAYLLRHRAEDAREDAHRLAYVTAAELPALLVEDLYAWGDLVWADFATPEPPTLAADAVAELLYYAHARRPLRDVAIAGLGNRFLAAGHDDGWGLALRYTDWRHVDAILARLVPEYAAIATALRDGASGFWLADGAVSPEIMTRDLDAVLNRRLAAR